MRGDIPMLYGYIDIKSIIRKYYDQLCAKNFNDLYVIDKSLKRHNVSSLKKK